jgi:hypothetical protein
MTKREREELNNMVCGSSLCREECHYRRLDLSLSPYQRWSRQRSYSRSSVKNYLVYDGHIFRCNVKEDCYRITPRTGKLRERRDLDPLKQSILSRRIKLLKETPELTKVKLVRSGKKIWIDVNGREVSPKWFNHSWWKFKWECEER